MSPNWVCTTAFACATSTRAQVKAVSDADMLSRACRGAEGGSEPAPADAQQRARLPDWRRPEPKSSEGQVEKPDEEKD
jgi:hypothetical protein